MQNKLYLLSQDEQNGYDTYDSAVVCAPSSAKARQIHPRGKAASPHDVTVRYLGKASPRTPVGVVCASFNAG